MQAKSEILSGRDNLRRNGIRVGDDLTAKQRQKLANMKRNGKLGYYYKGELHTHESNQEHTSRTFTNTARLRQDSAITVDNNSDKQSHEGDAGAVLNRSANID